MTLNPAEFQIQSLRLICQQSKNRCAIKLVMSSYFANLEAERLRQVEYWESSRVWFEEHGYFLYDNVDVGDSKYEYAKPHMEYPDKPPSGYEDDPLEDPFPYAFMTPGLTMDRPPYSTMDKIYGPVTYAQDIQGRSVAIKMLKTAEEYKVLRLLKNQARLQDPHSFPSVIPILDLLSFDGRWFAVMPRWGLNMNHDTFFPTFHLAIRYLISLLEGLAFLHELRIFNRDIDVRNTLVNNISSVWDLSLACTGYHSYLKKNGALRYAIMDFDLAMVLDEETYGSNPRLPIGLIANVGFAARPYETMHAYVDFDPFKYDVACLGIHFSDHFQQVIVDVPLLAPLIDRMITSDIEKRFTSSEALAFARTLILPSISSLGRYKRTPELGGAYHRIDRWAGLPESFIKEWSSYRENYCSWTMRFQNWLFVGNYDWPPGWYMMYYSRYTMRILTWLPRLLLRRFSLLVKKFSRP